MIQYQSKSEANRSRSLWVMIGNWSINSCAMYVRRIKNWVKLLKVGVIWAKHLLGETWIGCNVISPKIGWTVLGETWWGELLPHLPKGLQNYVYSIYIPKGVQNYVYSISILHRVSKTTYTLYLYSKGCPKLCIIYIHIP